MIRLLCIAWLALMTPVAAQTEPVQVTSGEHDGFTRVVLDYGATVDWRVGRTTDGYELRLTAAQPTYDLTGVYDMIPRGRLASVWSDPETGTLRIGIGCACHAQPFEFRPGIVVIDLKDGPPPAGSSFEQALDGRALPGLVDRKPLRPRARPVPAGTAVEAPAPYDWLALVTGRDPAPAPTPAGRAPAVPPTTLPGPDPSLQPLRDALLHQLSRGAAQGVVDMTNRPVAGSGASETKSVEIHLNQLPGVRIDDQIGPKGVAADGATCIAEDQLQVQDWGDDRPVVEQMAIARAGLMGEFDIPDQDSQRRALRFLLFIGFGAEARQVLAQLPVALPEAAVLSSLAHILDDSRDPTPAFAGMAACDTAAALWAILSTPAPEPGETLDRAAALRSFSALPLHLRRHLGPALAARFVSLDDSPAAEAVRDAILRAPGDAGPHVALMEARLDLDAGESARAEQRVEPLISNSGPATPEALITLVEARLAQRQAIDAAQITALEGLVHERGTDPDAARFARALTLARALAGDFDGAFADLAANPQAAADVWALLAEIGPESALLTHAVLAEGSRVAVAPDVAALLARRLSDLGLAAAARRWIETLTAPAPDLAARVALQAKDARTALRLLAGSEDPSAVAMRSVALRQLGDERELAAILAGSGDEEGRWRAVGRARDWLQLAVSGPDPWRDLAVVAAGGSAPPSEGSLGPLAGGQRLVEASAATRQAVTDLLAQIAPPAAVGP